jgi:hypothetical protein
MIATRLMKKELRDSIGIFVLLAAATILLTWPLASEINTALSNLGDPPLGCWMLAWDFHALSTNPAQFFHANMFYPALWTLAFSDLCLGQALLVLPVWLCGGGPILLHNVVLLLTFPLSGLFMFLLVRHLTGHRLAATISGLLYAFSHYRFSHLSHIIMLSHQWVPPIFLGLHRVVNRGGRWRDLWLTAAAFLLLALSSGYYFFIVIVGLLVFAGWWIGAGRWAVDRGFLLRAAAVGVVTGSLIVVSFLPYLRVHHEYGFSRSRRDTLAYSARPVSYLVVPEGNRLLGPWTSRFMTPEGTLFPGLVTMACVGAYLARRRGGPDVAAPRIDRPGRADLAISAALWAGVIGLAVLGDDLMPRPVCVAILALAALALVARRRRGIARPFPGWAWFRALLFPNAPGLYVLLAGVGVLCSFGTELRIGAHATVRPLFDLLFDLIPGMNGMRVPSRFAMLVNTGLCVLAGYGVAGGLSRMPGPRMGRAAAAALAALIVAEQWAVPLRFQQVRGLPTPADEWLAHAPPGPVVNLPMYEMNKWFGESKRVYSSVAHWMPLVNGYSSFAPPGYWETVRSLNRFPDPAAIEHLRRIGVRYVILHWKNYSKAQCREMMAALPGLAPGIAQVAAYDQQVVLELR